MSSNIKSPERFRAYELWLESGKKLTTGAIAKKLSQEFDREVSQSVIRVWRGRDGWNQERADKGLDTEPPDYRSGYIEAPVKIKPEDETTETTETSATPTQRQQIAPVEVYEPENGIVEPSHIDVPNRINPEYYLQGRLNRLKAQEQVLMDIQAEILKKAKEGKDGLIRGSVKVLDTAANSGTETIMGSYYGTYLETQKQLTGVSKEITATIDLIVRTRLQLRKDKREQAKVEAEVKRMQALDGLPSSITINLKRASQC